MGRPKKLQNVAKSNNGTTHAESNDLQFDSTTAIEENAKLTGNQSKKRTYMRKKETTQVASPEKHANSIEEVAFGYDCNMKEDKQDNQKGSLEEKKKRKITPRKKKTSATIVERESDDMPTVCHNKDTDKLGKRTNGKKRSKISDLKQDIDEGSLEVQKRRRNTSMQEPSSTTIVEKKSTKKSSQINLTTSASSSEANVVSYKNQKDLSELQGERPESESETRRYVMINDLRPYDRDWTIKVLVLRRGLVEPYSSTKGSGTMWKLILMDEQGTRIQAVIFNDVIDKFDHLFLKERTYLVSNGLVKPINPTFPSVHKAIEMTLSSQAYVDDAKIGIELDSIKYHIVPFMEIKHHAKNDIYIDVVGLVVNVDPLSSVTKFGVLGTSMKRNISLINSRSETIILTLWGDVAKIEGDILEDMAKERPIVALSKVKTSAYGGLLAISTLPITTLQVNPNIPEADTIRQWYNENGGESGSRTMVWEIDKQSVRVKIEDLIERPLPDFESPFCSFKATIIRIDNMDQPWYDACKVCNKKISKTKQGTECSKCAKSNPEHQPRYLMKMTVGDGERQLYVTLFEAAEKITGCPAAEFKTAKEEEGMQSEIHKALRNACGRSYIFTTKLDKMSDMDRKSGKIIADQVQNDEDAKGMKSMSATHLENPITKKIKVEKD